MTEARKFLINDIKAMLPSANNDFPFLVMLSDEGLYHLWQDLVNLTTMEAIT